MQGRAAYLSTLFLISDLLFTCLAFISAYFIKKNLFFPIGGLNTAPNYYIVLLLVIIIWQVSFRSFSPWEGKRRIDLSTAFQVAKAATFGILVLSLFIFLFKIPEFSRGLVLIFYVLDIFFVLGGRILLLKLLYGTVKKPFIQKNVLIFGSRKTARELISAITKDKESSIKILGCLEIDEKDVGKEVAAGVKVIGTISEIKDILLSNVVDEVLITMPLNKLENAEWYLSFINTFGITTRIIPYWYIRKFMASRPSFYAVDFEDFLAEPAMVLGHHPRRAEELVVKRAFDIIVATVGLLLTGPLFPVIAVAIKIASPGPVFYTQKRCGLYGRIINVYKFRTMVVDADKMLDSIKHLNEASGVVFKMKDDPRIIPYVGKILRKTSLDELPQLINVLKGDMSIVGPRPPIPEEVEKYEMWQRRRLSMRPGITCLWQIQKNRNDLSFDEWMELDLEYIDNWSLMLDLKIIWWTIPAVLFGRGR